MKKLLIAMLATGAISTYAESIKPESVIRISSEMSEKCSSGLISSVDNSEVFSTQQTLTIHLKNGKKVRANTGVWFAKDEETCLNGDQTGKFDWDKYTQSGRSYASDLEQELKSLSDKTFFSKSLKRCFKKQLVISKSRYSDSLNLIRDDGAKLIIHNVELNNVLTECIEGAIIQD